MSEDDFMYPPQPTTSCAWAILDPRKIHIEIRGDIFGIQHFILNLSVRRKLLHWAQSPPVSALIAVSCRGDVTLTNEVRKTVRQ